MIMIILPVLFFLSMIVILLVRSRSILNLITMINSLIVIIASIYLTTSVGIPIQLSANNYLFIDALSIYEILITGIIFILASIYARGYVTLLIKEKELSATNVKLFYIAYNLLLASVIGVFLSNNLALLWIFAELTTIFSAVLIVVLNAKENILAAIKYVFITSTAMLFSLAGIIILFASSKTIGLEPTLNWNQLMEAASQIDPKLMLFSFVLVFIGFAAKSGIVPFHAWLPPSHGKAASDVSVLLSSVVLNIGIYVIIRSSLLVNQTAYGSIASNILLVFGVLTVGIAGLSMLVRRNLKKLIAFSSIENMGFILIGVAVGNLFWVIYYVLAHALAKALLFFSAGIINRQYGSVKVGEIRDALKLQPLASIGLIIGSMAIVGIPLLPIFLPKFFILASLSRLSPFLTFVVLLFLLVAAGSYSWFILNMLTEQAPSGINIKKYSIPSSMKFTIIILIIILIFMGVYMPDYLHQLLNQAILITGGKN